MLLKDNVNQPVFIIWVAAVSFMFDHRVAGDATRVADDF